MAGLKLGRPAKEDDHHPGLIKGPRGKTLLRVLCKVSPDWEPGGGHLCLD